MNLATGLAEGVAALGLDVPPAAQRQLLAYLALLHKWNAIYNLTAVREPASMLTQHLLDALAVVPHLSGRVWVDVGSGAGLPGVPVAIVCPERTVTLIDSSHKKTTFLRQAAIELGLGNVEVVCGRVEEWRAGRAFDVVISRALSTLADFLTLAGRLCDRAGVLAAMKGVYPHEEIAQLPASYRLERVVPLAVPGLIAHRHLVLIRPV